VQAKTKIQIAAIFSLMIPGLAPVRADAAPRVVTLWDDIFEDATLRQGYTYVIDGEVHVLAGVRLTIEDGVNILIKNGKIRRRTIDRSALIFDQGSQLEAMRFQVKAAGADGRPEKRADNGGIWFLGSFHDASKDDVTVIVDRFSKPSRFSATEIHVIDLGNGDPAPSARNLNPRGDDIDGFSVLGVGPREWKIKSVRSDYSADDGFDVTNSEIELDSLVVNSPFEDGLNISSSKVRIRKHLSVEMTPDKTVFDRDVFDLEVDDGPSYVTMAKGCRVIIHGVLGDEIRIKSSDLPHEDRDGTEHFHFDGYSRRGPTSIYSRDQD
jgi:hypothetical protein